MSFLLLDQFFENADVVVSLNLDREHTFWIVPQSEAVERS